MYGAAKTDPPIEAPLTRVNETVDSPEYTPFGPLLWPIHDYWLLSIGVLGVVLLTVSTICAVRQDTKRHITLHPFVAALIDLPAETDIGNILSFCLALVFNLYNMTFGSTDLYIRSMQPVRGLKESRFADQNILVDYMSPDFFTVVIRAFDNKHWRVALHFLLYPLCQAAPIFAGHVFIRKRQGLKRSLIVDPYNFWTSYVIMWLYCLIMPFVRIPASYRAPHRLETAIDLLPYCYHSHIAQLPEFVSQDINDREAHINAQVILARRRYEFGLYRCEGGRRHMGIAVSELRTSRGSIRQPVDKIVVDSEWHRFGARFFRPPRIEPAPLMDELEVAGQYEKDTDPLVPPTDDDPAYEIPAAASSSQRAPTPSITESRQIERFSFEAEPLLTPSEVVGPLTASAMSQRASTFPKEAGRPQQSTVRSERQTTW